MFSERRKILGPVRRKFYKRGGEGEARSAGFGECAPAVFVNHFCRSGLKMEMGAKYRKQCRTKMFFFGKRRTSAVGHRRSGQGCQMISFQTKNTNLGKFWRTFEMENVDIFSGRFEYIYDHWVYLMSLW
jgi:hypothetical protein